MEAGEIARGLSGLERYILRTLSGGATSVVGAGESDLMRKGLIQAPHGWDPFEVHSRELTDLGRAVAALITDA